MKTNFKKRAIAATAAFLLVGATAMSQSWNLSGNAGTNSTTNFIGTTDNTNFKIRTKNNVRIIVSAAGKVAIGTVNPVYKLDVMGGSINTDSVYRINGNTFVANPGTGNLAIGVAALKLNTNRFNIVAVGDSALYNNSVGASFSDEAINNTAVGAKALKNNTKGGSNTALGFNALYKSVDGFDNTAIGSNALAKNTSGGINTAVGSKSMANNTTGSSNTAVGWNTLNSNTEGSYNTAMGHGTLQSNTTGSFNTALGDFCMPINITGFNNTAVGLYSMYHCIGGSENTGVGQSTLYQITSGTENVAVGSMALNDITSAIQNTAVGVHALQNNNGNLNTAVGYNALIENTTGPGNCAFGTFALSANLTGQENLAVGRSSLFNNTGSSNTACGNFALVANTTGSFNIGIGYFANVSTGGLTEAIAIGHNATVNASNKMQLGGSTTTLASTGGITIVSDGRFKNNVSGDDVPGLDFIRQLRPVAYNFDYKKYDDFLTKDISMKHTEEAFQAQLIEKSKTREVGFIAQEVNNTIVKNKLTFNGVYTPQNDNDNYAIDYSRFAVPLVKAVQELDAKTKEIETLKNEIEAIKSVLTADQKLKLTSTTETKAALYQNNPNPFNETTVISYTIPANSGNAVIKIYSSEGIEMRTVVITTKGFGQAEIKSGTLTAGTYTYMLIVDGKTLDSKQMVLTK